MKKVATSKERINGPVPDKSIIRLHAQPRLRSAFAFTESDQFFTTQISSCAIEKSNQTGGCSSGFWVFTGPKFKLLALTSSFHFCF